MKNKKRAVLKKRGKNKPLLEFIEEIKIKLIEKKEREELFNRVIIIKSEDVIRELNNKGIENR